MLLSEADIREKIIAPWLIAIGIPPNEIILEKTFRIKFGHGVYEVKSGKNVDLSFGRADYLVKNFDNKNLFIIESKKFGAKLDEHDRDQAISYARLVEGNIPPFVIITNGENTYLYDAISKERLNSDDIHLKNRLKQDVNCDDSLYSEALNYFIALNSETLINFCQSQVSYRMQPLKGFDLHSGKKYIPSLYCERTSQSKSLREFILTETEKKIFLITGSPQSGKTTFICREIEERLKVGDPCLFYPAISLKGGLLEAISEDFCWEFRQEKNVIHIVNRLSEIANKLNKKLTIFIDGLNETTKTLAFQINNECHKIAQCKIRIVLSITNNSISDFLFESGNPTYIADELRINIFNSHQYGYRSNSKKDNEPIINIEDFSETEFKEAFDIYAQHYSVIPNEKILNEKKLRNPFYLRVLMELYYGKQLPESIDQIGLLREVMWQKVSRSGLNKYNFLSIVNVLCQNLLNYDSPIDFNSSLITSGDDIKKLCYASLLCEQYAEGNSIGLDFYYSIERNFAISLIHRKWDSKFLSDEKTIEKELLKLEKTQSGREAFEWFLSNSAHINHLKHILSTKIINNKIIDTLIAQAIVKQKYEKDEDLHWLAQFSQNISNGVELRRASIYKMIKVHSLNSNYGFPIEKMFAQLLQIESVLNIEDGDIEDSFSVEIGEENNFGHVVWDNIISISDLSKIKFYAILLYKVDQRLFEKYYFNLITQRKEVFLKVKEDIAAVFKIMAGDHSMADAYCSVYYDQYDLEELCYSLKENEDYYGSIFVYYPNYEFSKYFLSIQYDIIENLQIKISKDPNQNTNIVKSEFEKYPNLLVRIFGQENLVNDPNQLSLPFNGEFQ